MYVVLSHYFCGHLLYSSKKGNKNNNKPRSVYELDKILCTYMIKTASGTGEDSPTIASIQTVIGKLVNILKSDVGIRERKSKIRTDDNFLQTIDC